jgi:glycosyltransferase involved in cell wall biosynthesis
MKSPKVSIGMPVYNGARLVERAVTSLLRQTFTDFELIISDNGSTDATGEICQRLASQDGRIRYVRQPHNIGAGENFLFVLAESRAPCFMWAAHDDFWEPEFVAANYEVLVTRPDVVLSVSLVEFASEQANVVEVGQTGTYALLDDPQQNLLKYLSEPAQNSRFYGLFRTEVLRECMRNLPTIWAADWLAMARTLKFGKHYEVNQCLLHRGPDGDSSQPAALIARIYRSSFFRIFPMLPYTWAVLTDPLIPKSLALWRPLAKWNKYFFDLQTQGLRASFTRIGARIGKWFTRKRRGNEPNDNAEVQAFQRLLIESVMSDWPVVERYSLPGDVVDCNALLDLADDVTFVDAAFRQVYGREANDGECQKWLKRQRLVSRAALLAYLRRKRTGRVQGTRIPGIVWALLLDRPREGWLRWPVFGSAMTSLRRWLVERSLRRCKDQELQRRTLRLADEPSRPALPVRQSAHADWTVTGDVVHADSSAKRIALITPWPPQPSGIADYAFDLAIGLSQQGAHITVFTHEPHPAQPGEEIAVRPLTEFRSAEPYDHVVYQMGSHVAYHGAMVPLLRKHGGIVHLHDMVLQHLIAHHSLGRGNVRLYERVLEHWYGEAAVQEFRAWNRINRQSFWESNFITEVPLFEPIVQFADACIVHSQFVEQRVSRHLPELPCQVLPQVYRNMPLVPKTGTSRFRIGIFGHIQPNKHVDKVLSAMACAVAQGADIELDAVGSLDVRCESLRDLARELGLADRVNWRGRTEESEFLAAMQRVDLCVALRYPTMGETSAVVSRALQMGLPTIVSDVGWYVELPSVVQQCTTNPLLMQTELNRLVARHALDANYHQAARRAAVDYARTHCDFAAASDRYLRALGELSGTATAPILQRLTA